MGGFPIGVPCQPDETTEYLSRTLARCEEDTSDARPTTSLTPTLVGRARVFVALSSRTTGGAGPLTPARSGRGGGTISALRPRSDSTSWQCKGGPLASLPRGGRAVPLVPHRRYPLG
jgi:hypothetical protein